MGDEMKAGSIAIAIAALGTGVTSAQDYPSKVIRIFTAGAGGGSDFIARQTAQGMSPPLGQPVIVDNRTPQQAAETVSKAPPDGYSLLVGGDGLWILALMRKMSYDPVKDFSPIVQISRDINVLVVHPSLPVQSTKELIALAKTRPGQLNYGSTPVGGSSHLAMELFKSMAGVNVVLVAYGNAGQAITAVVSGEVQVAIVPPATAAPHVKSGRLRTLAVTSAEPSSLLPDVATLASSLPGYEFVGVAGLWAPANTPAAIIELLNREVVRALNRPDVRTLFLNRGLEIVAGSPAQFAATIRSDMARIGKLIKDAAIKAD